MTAELQERAEIEAELARVLASPEFVKNRGAAHFLKFVVEETLAGRGDRLKAFTIATQALARKDTFDSQADSAVRVQALRLRKLLAAWYEGPGAQAPLRIELKPGTYKPAFLRAQAGEPDPAAPRRFWDRFRLWSGPRSWSWRRFGRAQALGLAFFLPALLGLMTAPASPPASNMVNAPPIPSLRVDADRGGALADLAHALEVEFSAFDNVIVRKPGGEDQPREPNAYALALRALDRDFAAELLRLSDRTVVWAGRFPTPGDAGARARQARELAQTLGDAYGVIDLDALRLLTDFDGMPRGFNCTLNAFTFLKIQSMERLRVARACLEIAVGVNARDDDARAMLAIVLVFHYFFAPPGRDPRADLARADLLAQQAFALAPLRARSYFARFLTAFARGRFDEAFRDARAALALNGNSSLFLRGVGSAYILRGDVDAGMKLAAPLIETVSDESAALGVMALGHELRGETRQAAQLLARPGASERALALILQISLCGADASCAHSPLAALRRNFPGVAQDIAAALDRMGMAEPVKARLLPGLRAAGAVSDAQPEQR
jgi:tetratricopeptide (TPR) repeat protein